MGESYGKLFSCSRNSCGTTKFVSDHLCNQLEEGLPNKWAYRNGAVLYCPICGESFDVWDNQTLESQE